MLIVRQTLFFIYLVLMAYFSLLPGDEISIQTSDKVLHFAAYTVMVLLSAWSFGTNKQFLFSLPFIFFYGIGIELAQSMTATREPSLLDVVANSIGIAIGYCIVLLCQKSTFLSRFVAASSE